MEVKFNVAAILKDKPKGTKLYDYLHNIDVEFNDVETTEIETSIWCTREKGGYNELFGYSKLGTLRGWLDGLQILLPSKEMRDWSKFAWKKGDVLVSNDSDSHIIFKGFSKNDYTTFEGKHWISVSKKRHVSCLEMQNVKDYHIEDNKDSAQTYINTIEERLGGKLNRETLEIEKQYEFKDGDIVFVECEKGLVETTFIYKMHDVIDIHDEAQCYAAIFNKENKSTTCGSVLTYGRTLRFATDSEKQQLFSALKKQGKAWDAEKKQIVDLKPKCEFKSFDRCIWKIRNCEGSIWQASFVSYVNEYGATPMGISIDEDLVNLIILPYNDQTKLLVGTTDEWKGGEQ